MGCGNTCKVYMYVCVYVCIYVCMNVYMYYKTCAGIRGEGGSIYYFSKMIIFLLFCSYTFGGRQGICKESTCFVCS